MQYSERWYQYLQGGIAQVLHTNLAYTPNFKQQVLETEWQNGLSLTQTATRFQIPSGGIIWQWDQAALTQGWDATQTERTAPIMAKKKLTPQKPLTQIQALEAENAQLRMENVFLKKLNALVQARKKEAYAQVSTELRHTYPLNCFLACAKLARSTYYAVCKRMRNGDKYACIRQRIAGLIRPS